ncbi:T2SP_E domain-containing protein [Candidatus Hydrogenisulfobacillus filiaventi]|uniref:T2SP_E domain-containing protein n=1 Tax=Candidatus Hydrogenisulfobacillus filiaventi TaxID=2707344 RepID=A0A6F8ZIE6_9FIRM|nr:T2SP_E domain-containing protein [Candidatus Hydrogenisulfobacillus filiaventi]
MNAVTEYLRRPARLRAVGQAAEESGRTDELLEAAWAWLDAHRPDLLAFPERFGRGAVEEALVEAVASVRPSPPVRDRLLAVLRAQLLGAAALEPYMRDPAVTEILLDGRQIRTERRGAWVEEPALGSVEEARQLAIHLTTRAGSRYQPTLPLQTVIWPDNGARIHVVHESVSAQGVPLLTIRKRNAEAVLDLTDLVARGMLSEALAAWLMRAVRARLNLCIAGPTGSGKTTVLRALARAAIPRDERVISMEDTPELQLDHELPHAVGLVARERMDVQAAQETVVTLHDLFVNTLRMRPDRIVVGEVRSAEALDTLEAGVTEAGGMLLTIHLRRASALVARLAWILRRSGVAIPRDELAEQVAEAIDLVVQIGRPRDAQGVEHRRILAVTEPQPDGTQRTIWSWDGTTWRQEADLSPDRERMAAMGGWSA